MIRKLLSITFLFGLLPLTAFAQQKPDFSGTWKLNVTKSDFGPAPGFDNRTDVITHKDPSLTVSSNSDGALGKLQYTANYTTDGKEVVNKFADREFKSTVKWQDDNLVVNSKFNFNDTDITAVATWALATDGKTLTINAHFSSSMGEADQKLLFEKQDSGAVTAPAKNP